IDVGPAAPLHLPLHAELDQAGADRGRGAERVLVAERDPQPVVLVDEGQSRGALARDVAEGRAGRPESARYPDSSVVHESAVVQRHPCGVTLLEEAVLDEPLRPQHLPGAIAYWINRQQDVADVLDHDGR